MLETTSKAVSSWPSAAASISLGATVFVTHFPSDRGIRFEIAQLPNAIEDPLFGALLSFSFILGLYVLGSLILLVCDLLRKRYDPKEKERFQYMMSEATEREYSEWKSVEIRTQIIFAALAIIFLGMAASMSFVISGIASDSWLNQLFNVIAKLTLFGGFIGVIRKFAAAPYRQLDEVAGISERNT